MSRDDLGRTKRPTASGSSPAGSVSNALRVLLLFRESPSVRVADVARELGVARSTAHRLLTTLEHHRYATQRIPGGMYEPGPALLDVGLRALAKFDFRTVSRPHIERLRAASTESVCLVVLDGPEAVVLDFVSGTHRLKVVERVGARAPAHSTAAGKAVLAALGSAEFDRLYPAEILPPAPAQAVRTRERLKSEIDRIRSDGFALNREESGAGCVGIAAAVVHRVDGAIGAVSLALPGSRLNDDLGSEFGSMVGRTADEISAALP